MRRKFLMSFIFMVAMMYGLLILFLMLVFKHMDLSIILVVISFVIVSVLQFIFAPIIMDFFVENIYQAKFNFKLPDYLTDFINDVCIKNNISFPKIGYINDGSPNAFTYGKTRNDARIILSKGIFDLLSKDEIKTVVAHELGHIAHYDVAVMTIVQVVPTLLYYVYSFSFDFFKNRNRDNDSSISKQIALLFAIAYFLYLISQFAILWFSRAREYYADEFAVHATGNPNALSSSLVKIGFGFTSSDKNISYKSSTNLRGFSIFDGRLSKGFALGSYNRGKVSKERIKLVANWELSNPWAKWHEFFSTHPLISKRIIVISKFSKLYNQETYIEFEKKKNILCIFSFISDILFILFPIFVIIFFIKFGSIYGEYLKISYMGYAFFALVIAMLILILKMYNIMGFKHKKVIDLLVETNVSKISPVPCIVEGKIIGRGKAGNIFSEDLIIKDDTGIMFLEYQQPLTVHNTLFALFKAKDFINKKVIVKGWYRRNTKPYIEVYSIKIDDKISKIYTYMALLISLFALVVVGFCFVLLEKVYGGFTLL